MANVTLGVERSASSVSWWRDERKLGYVWQGLVVAGLALAVAFIAYNLVQNLRILGVPLGLDFLDAPAGFAISFSLFPTNLESRIGQLILAGMLNTLLAAAISIVLATIWGFLLGVLRLSRNYLISRLATVYVEAIRNVPLLVQLLFWYAGIVKLLPNVRQAINIEDLVFLSNRGIYAPRPVPQDDFGFVLIAFLIGVAGAVWVSRWARRHQEATGRQFPAFWTGAALVLGLPMLVSLVVGQPLEWEAPALQGFNFQGGMVLQPELAALVIGLTAYSASYIAEVVRGGILAVSHGQTEAALALGLKNSWTLRLVIIPQAMRVIVPPLTSNYLNIAKNSTLAGAIGYPDIYSIIGTSQNQTGRAVEAVTILMLFFLSLSLLISLLMNWYNKRIALVER
jgi:general L-amino acid transport system permease protein